MPAAPRAASVSRSKQLPEPASVTARLGFSKRSHLRKTDEISSVFDFRCRETGPFLSINARPNPQGQPRLAVMVARKISLLAVERNYMRRVLREAFRLQQHQIAALDIVARVTRKFDRSRARQVREEFTQHLSRLSKCQNSSSG